MKRIVSPLLIFALILALICPAALADAQRDSIMAQVVASLDNPEGGMRCAYDSAGDTLVLSLPQSVSAQQWFANESEYVASLGDEPAGITADLNDILESMGVYDATIVVAVYSSDDVPVRVFVNGYDIDGAK